MSLIATRLQDWRIKNPQFDRNMTRPLEYGALDFFIGQTNSGNSIISPDLKARAFESMGNTVRIPAIDFDGNVTVSNVRSCVIGDAENTSALYTLVWATFAVGFTMVPSLYLNNEIGYDQDFSRKLEKVSRALAIKLDQAAVAALDAKKTQVFESLLYYTQSGNVVQVPWGMRDGIFSDVNTMMRANAYPGQIHIIGNAGIDSMLRKLAQHGLYNDQNKRMEFEDKIIHFTNNINNAEGNFGTFFAVEDGNVGVLTRVDRESLLRSRYGVHEWDQVRLPFVDLPVGSHYYISVGDQSEIAGAASADMTCNGKEHYGFSVDVAFLVAYNSDEENIANPIIKAAIGSSTAQNPLAAPVYVTNGESDPVYTQAVQAGQ
jgi:hypothetical protein